MEEKLKAIRDMIEAIVKRKDDYDKANAALKEHIGGDFLPTYVIDGEIISPLLNVLKVFLGGDDVCEYFLYEKGGKISVQKSKRPDLWRHYNISSIDDVMVYIAAECKL